MGVDGNQRHKAHSVFARPPPTGSQALLWGLVIRLSAADSSGSTNLIERMLWTYPLESHLTVRHQKSGPSGEDRLPGAVSWEALIDDEATKPRCQAKS